MIMTNNYDFVSKELVKTLAYTTAGQNRDAYSEVVINGRKYIKTGTLQVVTVVCNVWKVLNKETNIYEYQALFGLSKQHPDDICINKDLAYEIANTNSFIKPFIQMQVNKRFGENTFRDIIRSYIADMDLEYVKTKDEINLQNK